MRATVTCGERIKKNMVQIANIKCNDDIHFNLKCFSNNKDIYRKHTRFGDLKTYYETLLGLYAMALNSQHAKCPNDINRHHYHQTNSNTSIEFTVSLSQTSKTVTVNSKAVIQ